MSDVQILILFLFALLAAMAIVTGTVIAAAKNTVNTLRGLNKLYREQVAELKAENVRLQIGASDRLPADPDDDSWLTGPEPFTRADVGGGSRMLRPD